MIGRGRNGRGTKEGESGGETGEIRGGRRKRTRSEGNKRGGLKQEKDKEWIVINGEREKVRSGVQKREKNPCRFEGQGL